jgi:hypothetical protein
VHHEKGKPTYLGLTRRQWIDRLLEVDPTTKSEEITDEYHIVEIAQACEPGSDSDDLESVDSEDEEQEHTCNGDVYKGKELLDLWESEADEAKQKFKAYEKANKPAKKQKTKRRQGPEAGKRNRVEPLSPGQPHGSRPVGLQEVL